MRRNLVSFLRVSARRPSIIRRYGPVTAIGLLLATALGLVPLPVGALSAARSGENVGCSDPRVVDGDTLRCGAVRIRLQGIDAPELPGHCARGRQCVRGDPFASTDNLRALVRGAAMTCRKADIDRYGRIVARCSARGRDLSCEQVKGGFAVRRYAELPCP